MPLGLCPFISMPDEPCDCIGENCAVWLSRGKGGRCAVTFTAMAIDHMTDSVDEIYQLLAPEEEDVE